MKELSLNILDVAKNSVKANASLVEISLTETDETLTLKIKDDGCGMDEETVKSVENPFYTTRTTRKVGLGIPFLKEACEQTGGRLKIESKPQSKYAGDSGTEIEALFYKNHLDFTPLGDIVSTVTTLISGSPQIDFSFSHTKNGKEVSLKTAEMREILGDVPLDSYEVIKWSADFLNQQYAELK